MYYLIGDIHGEIDKLENLMKSIMADFNNRNDTLIFLGDYIDRGNDSYRVVEYLLTISEKYKTVFLRGNHEQMLYEVVYKEASIDNYLLNGGKKTIESYNKKFQSFHIPLQHKKVLFTERFYFETDDFIAVHAGIPPETDTVAECRHHDLIWIRNNFYNSDKHWPKTIIFGHTPTFFINGEKKDPFFDDEKNIIGIDTGAVYNGVLTCIRMPDKKIYQA